jgi:gliding motility-associated-like protein
MKFLTFEKTFLTMKKLTLLYLLLFFSNVFSQVDTKKPTCKACILEDKYVNIIKYNKLHKKKLKFTTNKFSPIIQIPTDICTNGGFEDYETIQNETVLKNFISIVRDMNSLITPIEGYVPISNPSNLLVKSVSVPNNYIDTYIGNINGFGQKVLKVGQVIDVNNPLPIQPNEAIVQTIRYKSNNETELKFNYKEVVQASLNNQTHVGIQPYFSARILDLNDNIVSEFTVVADRSDCNLTFISEIESEIGYTKNWQTCTLDISTIPNLQNFKIEFISATCALGGHFAYAFIDDICIQQSNQTNQGTITLNPFNINCPSSPFNVCGEFTVPNTDTSSALVSSIALNIYDANQNIVYSNSNPTNIDLINNTFCFELNLSNFPNIANANYNVGVVINYANPNTNCSFNIAPAYDYDAAPGFDISFNNCNYPCNLVTQNFSTFVCDLLDDKTQIQNLSQYNLNLANSLNYNFYYYNTLIGAQNQIASDQIINFTAFNLNYGTNTIYVRIFLSNICFQIATLTLDLVSPPTIPINDIGTICEGSFITLNGGNNYDSYTWSTGETSQYITITQPGNYSVIVTENHGTTTCTSSKNFTAISSNIATIQEIITTDWTDYNNTITVLLHNNSIGDYEYSLNGIDFQNSNVFDNLEAGEYTVFVRDKNGCGIVSEELYLLTYPKFFTPNGDGYNDYWKIKFSKIEPNLTVKIFDRYGKLLKQFGTNSMGWDGKYLDEDVSSSDYWFIVTRENGKEYKGHFSLKR